MDFKEVVAKRHSVRAYAGKAIDREILDEIIAEALTAPSSKNSKSSGFLIVEDPDTIQAISAVRDRGSQFLAGAAAAIVVLGDETKSNMWDINSTISATFIQLAAVNCGLGSCWVHVKDRDRTLPDGSKQTSEDYLRDLLGIKDNCRVMCVIALGYPQE